MRRCHRWSGRSSDELASQLAVDCDWLIAHDIVPTDAVTRNRRIVEAVLRPWTPVFIHGDLQADHVFIDDERVTRIID